jgi:hypothetical protein
MSVNFVNFLPLLKYLAVFAYLWKCPFCCSPACLISSCHLPKPAIRDSRQKTRLATSAITNKTQLLPSRQVLTGSRNQPPQTSERILGFSLGRDRLSEAETALGVMTHHLRLSVHLFCLNFARPSGLLLKFGQFLLHDRPWLRTFIGIPIARLWAGYGRRQ